MKKTLVFILALSMLTACNAEEKTSETAKVNEPTAIVTETPTEAVTEAHVEAVKSYDDLIHVCEDFTQYFESLSEFESYMQSGKMSEDYDNFHYPDGTTVTFDHVKPFIPVFDENKYEILQISLNNAQYGYRFRNIETDERFSATIDFDTYYHTFEELAKRVGVKIELEPDRTTTVLNGTPAIFERITERYPQITHEIYVMLDEDNCLHFRGGDTAEKIKTAIEEITFKAIPSAEELQQQSQMES